jgi:uncharacterized membrane protein required for colicin V production
MAEIITVSVLILTVVIAAIVGIKRGFVRSIAGLLVYIVSYIIANRFYTLIVPYTSKIPFIVSMTSDVEMPEVEAGTGFIGKIGAIMKYLFDNALNSGSDPTETARAVINNFLAELIAQAISFLALFIVSVLVLKLLTFLIGKIFDLPGLNAVNRVLGLVFGVLSGFFITWILSNLFVGVILPILVDKFPDVFSASIGENVIVQFFMKFSPVALVMYLVNKIGSIGAVK